MTQSLDLDKLKTLAHRATRSAQARFGSMDITERDYWDMRQEAATAIWKAVRAGKPVNIG